MTKIKARLKKFPKLVMLKRRLWDILNIGGHRGKSSIDLTAAFPLFRPCSAGVYKDRAALTTQSINQLIPSLQLLLNSFSLKSVEIEILDELLTEPDQKANANDLKMLLDFHQSDKASTHNYFFLYSDILKQRTQIKRVFEIGLGTNNTDVVSNMGRGGKPGASLRAFRDFLENAEIYGADIDKRVLFSEERIKTFWIDQTDRKSFLALNRLLPNDFDLMIDDGLHSPNANIHSLEFFLPKLRVGGWAVIEDIGEPALPLWEIIASLLPPNFKPHIFRTNCAILFAVRRLG